MKRDFVRQLRRDQTDMERKLWQALRGRRFHGEKFRRQQPVGGYIVDFVSFGSRLVIELDGGQHGTDASIAQDATRTQALERDGFRVLRFWNNDVDENLDGVLGGIARHLGA